MNNWRYDFDCRDCGNKVQVGNDVYCIPGRALKKPIHAGDDFVVRCDEYKPMQITFEEVRQCANG